MALFLRNCIVVVLLQKADYSNEPIPIGLNDPQAGQGIYNRQPAVHEPIEHLGFHDKFWRMGIFVCIEGR
jgi:hypothetical protein